jgi:hypothetical protein
MPPVKELLQIESEGGEKMLRQIMSEGVSDK